MTITGTNFAAGATVTFGCTAATNVVVVNSTTITATTPAGSAGAVTVTVTNSGGQSGSLTSGFTYIAPPTVSSVAPNNGSTSGGTAVTITGTNFAAGATVTFGAYGSHQRGGGEQHDDHGDDAGGECGCGDGDGDELGGQSGSLTNGFTYVVRPTVSERVAEQRPGGRRDGGDDHGDELRSGSDGDVRQHGGHQRGGGEQHDDHGDDAGRECGSGDGDGDELGRAERKPDQRVYLYRHADGDAAYSPNNGPTTGGTAVTITGTNFAAGATVKFGSAAATQRGGGEQHDDHGDDAGGQRGCGDGDGDELGRAERESGQWVHLQRDRWPSASRR